MKDLLNTFWHLSKGIRIQFFIAMILIIPLGIILILNLAQPTETDNLSETERSYPQATPQPFRHQEEKDTGTLVVTANVPGVRVLLDASSHPEPEDPIPRGQKWPNNIPPFTVEKMPVGKHVLYATNPPDYDTATVTFEIKKDEITRVFIELIPLRTSD